jgi:hypothetical protein
MFVPALFQKGRAVFLSVGMAEVTKDKSYRNGSAGEIAMKSYELPAADR